MCITEAKGGTLLKEKSYATEQYRTRNSALNSIETHKKGYDTRRVQGYVGLGSNI